MNGPNVRMSGASSIAESFPKLENCYLGLSVDSRKNIKAIHRTGYPKCFLKEFELTGLTAFPFKNYDIINTTDS